MNNLSTKINQNANEKYTEEIYRTNSKAGNSSVKLSSIFNKNIDIKNDKNQNGGTNKDYNTCMKILNAFNNNDINRALTMIVNNINIDWTCQDDNGNTVLHHLILCCSKIEGAKKVLEILLKKSDISCIINTKNYKGQTPFLSVASIGLFL